MLVAWLLYIQFFLDFSVNDIKICKQRYKTNENQQNEIKHVFKYPNENRISQCICFDIANKNLATGFKL